MRLFYWRLALPFLLACSSPSAVAPSTPTTFAPDDRRTVEAAYRIVDATGPFWLLWSKARDAPLDEQRRWFKDIVTAAHPELFQPEVIGLDPAHPADDIDARLLAYLPKLPARIRAMRRVTDSVRTDLARHDSTFRETFPDMRWSGTIYFTVALDAFNGGTRPVGGETALLFGVDKIAALQGEDANLGPLFHHELFHVYHGSVNAQMASATHGPVYQDLWCEGLAVYVSKRLNPDATWAQAPHLRRPRQGGSRQAARARARDAREARRRHRRNLPRLLPRSRPPHRHPEAERLLRRLPRRRARREGALDAGDGTAWRARATDRRGRGARGILKTSLSVRRADEPPPK
jgi:hypothetical protein